jgi:hypothetical protein
MPGSLNTTNLFGNCLAVVPEWDRQEEAVIDARTSR